VVIPTWVECDIKKEEGHDLTPLEQFIYDQEPVVPTQEEKFRDQLQAVVDSLR
jgi:hypothetical protein